MRGEEEGVHVPSADYPFCTTISAVHLFAYLTLQFCHVHAHCAFMYIDDDVYRLLYVVMIMIPMMNNNITNVFVTNTFISW